MEKTNDNILSYSQKESTKQGNAHEIKENLVLQRIKTNAYKDFVRFPKILDFKKFKSKEQFFGAFLDESKKEIKTKDKEIEIQIALFVFSIFSVQDKVISKNFMTVEFLNFDTILMLLFLRILNSKLSGNEKMFLTETPFQNIATVLGNF
jgi:hypothetical protein